MQGPQKGESDMGADSEQGCREKREGVLKKGKRKHRDQRKRI